MSKRRINMDNKRIIGFDVARALAVFGMVLVNFKIVLTADNGNVLLLWLSSLFEGRASALFVVLAGVGITFLSNKARNSGDKSAINDTRKAIIKRGFIMFLIGISYTTIWEADILHLYAFYFLIAATLVTISNKNLLFVLGFIVLLFPVLMVFFDYDQGWNWATYTYTDYWTIDGMIRRIIFNGFHPIIPWAAFLIYGMWLGRQNLLILATRRKILLYSTFIFVVIETLFYLLRYWLKQVVTTVDGLVITAQELSELEILLSTSIIPPFPQYMLSAGSLATIVIILCIMVSERFQGSKIIKYLYKSGQLSLTLYVAHVIIGMGLLESINRLENQSIEFSMLAALMFYIAAMIFSVLWLKRLKVGPLEWVFRLLVK